jgi:hypothetical protein
MHSEAIWWLIRARCRGIIDQVPRDVGSLTLAEYLDAGAPEVEDATPVATDAGERTTDAPNGMAGSPGILYF